MSNTPIQFLGTPSISGLVVSNDATTPNTKLDVSAGACLASDGQNYITCFPQVIDATIVGANGIDTGALAASTWYKIYAIGSSANKVQPTVILSLASSLVPVLPAKFDIYRVVGYWYCNSSTNFSLGKVAGTGVVRKHFHDTSISVVSAGAAVALTAVSVLPGAPALDNLPIYVTGTFIPGAAGDKTSFFTGSSTATVGMIIDGTTTTKANSDNFQMLSTLVSGVPTVQYINSATSGSTALFVNGFEYNL